MNGGKEALEKLQFSFFLFSVPRGGIHPPTFVTHEIATHLYKYQAICRAFQLPIVRYVDRFMHCDNLYGGLVYDILFRILVNIT